VAFYLCTRILKALFETLFSKKEKAMPHQRYRTVVRHQQDESLGHGNRRASRRQNNAAMQ
jgi:hypothetical protein